jgi:hypothetical protein
MYDVSVIGFYRTLDPNEKLPNLNDLITGLFDESVPFRTRCYFDSDTPWFDASVGRAVLERDIAYIFSKVNRDHYTRDHFKLMHNRAKNAMKYSKRLMMSHLDINQPSKSLWRRITDLGLRKALPIIGDVDVNGSNEFFTSLGPNAGGVAFSVLFHAFTLFSVRSVTAQKFAEAIFSINLKQSGWITYPLNFLRFLRPL